MTWPWVVAGTHVHFLARGSEGEERLVCARARDTPRSLIGMARGQHIVAAMSVGLPVCKRCTRDLPRNTRAEVQRLASDVGL